MTDTESPEDIEIPDTAAEVIDMFNHPAAEREAPNYHTILEVWREILAPADQEATKEPAPQWSAKMVQSYPQLTFPDCVPLRDRYFEKLQQIRSIIEFEIHHHPGCLSWATPEEDVEENGEIYKSVLLTWQQLVLQWELEWSCEEPAAAAELASIAEAHKTLFGGSERSGMTAFLDNIKFEYTEADQELIAQVLTEQRDAFEQGESSGE